MGLTIQGKTVAAQNKVTVHGNECTALKMYGNEVWRKDGWETVFSGSRVYTSTGSMAISGLKAGDTVDITATAEFSEYNGYGTYSYSDSLTRSQLPTSLTFYSYASISLTVSDNKINFVFNGRTESFKGQVSEYKPVKLTITEVRVKR